MLPIMALCDDTPCVVTINNFIFNINTIIMVVMYLIMSIVVVIGHRLLEVLLKHCPGMAEAHLLLAESHHLAGDSPVALRKVAHVLHHAPDMIPAHLLLTRIYLHLVCALNMVGSMLGECASAMSCFAHLRRPLSPPLRPYFIVLPHFLCCGWP